jgi:hypothetical protein
MDDSVLRALAKWPDVPAAYGWLALDRRGNWSIKGERIGNPALVDFIGRNYGHDERGRWFFQNGPQSVFVRLEYTPYVLRTGRAASGLTLHTHTGMPARPRAAWLDDAGSLLVAFGDSVGVVHGHDLAETLSFLRMPRRCASGRCSGGPSAGVGGASGSAGHGRRHGARGPHRSDRGARALRVRPEPRPAPGEPEC